MGRRSKRTYKIDIQSLREKRYEYHFEGDSDFFQGYESSPVDTGKWECDIVLERSSTMLQLEFRIKGDVILVSDRSLREFDYPFETTFNIIYKFGEELEELDENVWVIPLEIDQLDLADVMYEYIVLALPMKKLHPEERELEQEEELIYQSEQEETQKDSIDPRWEKLKNLKN